MDVVGRDGPTTKVSRMCTAERDVGTPFCIIEFQTLCPANRNGNSPCAVNNLFNTLLLSLSVKTSEFIIIFDSHFVYSYIIFIVIFISICLSYQELVTHSANAPNIATHLLSNASLTSTRYIFNCDISLNIYKFLEKIVRKYFKYFNSILFVYSDN